MQRAAELNRLREPTVLARVAYLSDDSGAAVTTSFTPTPGTGGTSGGRRPLIAIPARFSATASALRFGAEVIARKLAEAVYRAGGEPLTVHPATVDGHVHDDEVAQRLAFADGVLLPGGGDVAPTRYGGSHHSSLYDTDVEQDAFDLAVARVCLRAAVPLLAICRGMQVVNVACGGDLVQDMPTHHRHLLSDLALSPGTRTRQVLGRDQVRISCYHHQAVHRLGKGLRIAAQAGDGVIEALEHDGPGWLLAVQWHPEDTAMEDAAQQAAFDALVRAAGERSAQRSLRRG